MKCIEFILKGEIKMIDFDVEQRNLDNYPYMEIPQNWSPIVMNFFDECYELLDRYNLPRDTVQFLETKEKYNQLRIYFSVNKLLDDDITGLDCILYKSIEALIAVIVEKYEKTIKYMVKEGLL